MTTSTRARRTRRAVSVLRAEFNQLEAEVTDLRTSLSREVRTRRLVVVDGSDSERVWAVTQEADGAAGLWVSDGRGAEASLMATPGDDDAATPAVVDLSLAVAGQVVVEVSASDRDPGVGRS
ncbi:MAG: hypothetical protein JWP02_3032 [Acidimicrobiales bacterium]|nr:hypothetical protein [Acidimicrobiales bacterium]